MILEKTVSNFVKEITVRKFKKEENLGQKVLIKHFLGKKEIFQDDGEIVFERFVKVKYNPNAKEKLEINREKILEELEKEKHFLIDLSFYNYHNEKGKKSLKVQVIQSLSEIRNFLFDTNLILIGKIDLKLSNFVKICERNEFPFEKFNAVILDPYGEEIFEEKDLEKYNLFLFGGIVDVGQKWYYATKYLFQDLDFPRKRIELKGSIKGVPDRINILIKILLESYYLKIPLEKAIVKNQGKKEIFERLYHEKKKGSKNFEEVVNVNHPSFNEIYKKVFG
ncbi:MAG: hypothetical protein QXQ14_02590 [Candidatus Aenigmatarchaeota archaeon]